MVDFHRSFRWIAQIWFLTFYNQNHSQKLHLSFFWSEKDNLSQSIVDVKLAQYIIGCQTDWWSYFSSPSFSSNGSNLSDWLKIEKVTTNVSDSLHVVICRAVLIKLWLECYKCDITSHYLNNSSKTWTQMKNLSKKEKVAKYISHKIILQRFIQNFESHSIMWKALDDYMIEGEFENSTENFWDFFQIF